MAFYVTSMLVARVCFVQHLLTSTITSSERVFMTTSKRANPLLPFVLCATSVFADDVDVTLQDKEFQRALRRMARLEAQMGQTAFEQLMATVARSVSKVAWTQLLEAAESQHQSSNGASRPSLH